MQAEAGAPDAAVAMELGMRPEALDEQQIELLIHEQVHQKLQVILEGEMALALQDFVDKVSAFHAALPIYVVSPCTSPPLMADTQQRSDREASTLLLWRF